MTWWAWAGVGLVVYAVGFLLSLLFMTMTCKHAKNGHQIHRGYGSERCDHIADTPFVALWPVCGALLLIVSPVLGFIWSARRVEKAAVRASVRRVRRAEMEMIER